MGPRPSVRTSERGIEVSEWQSFPLSGLSWRCPQGQGPEPKDPAPPSPSLTGSPPGPSLACSPKGDWLWLWWQGRRGPGLLRLQPPGKNKLRLLPGQPCSPGLTWGPSYTGDIKLNKGSRLCSVLWTSTLSLRSPPRGVTDPGH